MKLAYPIIHQQQPTPRSCTATCVAMALGVSVAELGVSLTSSYGFDDFGIFLAERGIWMRRGVRIDNFGERFHSRALYLVGVRSLNIVNSDHSVLLDTRGPRKDGPEYNERSGWRTLDPVMGREGKQHYTWVDETVVLDFCELMDRSSSAIFV